MSFFKRKRKFNSFQKRILIINDNHHSIIGGTENYTYKLIKIFTNLNHNVFELNLKYKNSDLILNNYENIKHKINKLERKSTNFILFWFASFINYLKFNLLIHKILKKKNIDIVIDNSQYASYKFLKPSNKKKFIWVSHNDITKIYNQQKSFWYKIKMIISLKSNRLYFNKIIVFSEIDKKWLLNNNKKIRANNVLICPLAHKSYEKINNFNIEEKLRTAKNIVSMGRLEQNQKNISFIAKIAQKLINENINIYVWGEGPDKNIIIDKPGIRYQGSFKKDEVDEILKKTKLLLLPSFFEGFPYVIVEALSNGVPCLVANTFINAKYLIDQTRGCCIENFDIDYWIKKIIYFNNLTIEKYKEYCKNSINFAKKFLTENNFESFWTNIIDKI